MKQGKHGKNRSVEKTIELQLAFHGGAVLAAFSGKHPHAVT